MAQPLSRSASCTLAASKIRIPTSCLRQSTSSSFNALHPKTFSTSGKCSDPSFSCRKSLQSPRLIAKPLTSRPPYHTRLRSFSSTPPSRATVVLQNPRTDEDGNDMVIEISPRAAKRLQQITSPPKTPSAPQSPANSHLRVTVTSGGCHGFQYLMSLEAASEVDAEEDTIFASEDVNSGEGCSGGKAEVAMDSASLELLKGSTIDFTTELIGSQFKITGNPRAKSSCGCGTSFDID